MGLPAELAASLERQLGDRVTGARRVAGGSINDAFRVELERGGPVFLKTRPGADPEEFIFEAASLRWLAEPGAALVPEVLGVGEEPAWIAISWVEPGALGAAGWEELGAALARTHLAGAAAFGALPPGAPGDSWLIASLELPFAAGGDWAGFHAERQLLPLVELARDRGGLERREAEAVERLCERLPSLAGPEEPPARLHGDLWSGNVLAGRDGRGRLIDPAAYGGHREIDLAMLRLFGDPGPGFIRAYEEVAPLADGHEARVALWQVLPLLVHAALFGGGYGASAAAAARRYL